MKLPSLLFSLLTILALMVGGCAKKEPQAVAQKAPEKPKELAIPPTAEALAANVPPPQVEAGYLKLGFEQLAAYNFTPPPFDPAAKPNEKPPTGEEQIPPVVRSWNRKKAIVTGYMVPVKMDKGLVTEFLLMRNTMACCFGTTPNMNEWVVVKMKNGVQPMMDVPVSFYGELKVGAMFENGYMTGLYELDGEKMGEVQG